MLGQQREVRAEIITRVAFAERIRQQVRAVVIAAMTAVARDVDKQLIRGTQLRTDGLQHSFERFAVTLGLDRHAIGSTISRPGTHRLVVGRAEALQ